MTLHWGLMFVGGLPLRSPFANHLELLSFSYVIADLNGGMCVTFSTVQTAILHVSSEQDHFAGCFGWLPCGVLVCALDEWQPPFCSGIKGQEAVFLCPSLPLCCSHSLFGAMMVTAAKILLLGTRFWLLTRMNSCEHLAT